MVNGELREVESCVKLAVHRAENRGFGMVSYEHTQEKRRVLPDGQFCIIFQVIGIEYGKAFTFTITYNW